MPKFCYALNPEIPDQIDLYFHCSACIIEKPSDVSARDWARFEIGTSGARFQVRCVRHERNIAMVTAVSDDTEGSLIGGCGVCGAETEPCSDHHAPQGS